MCIFSQYPHAESNRNRQNRNLKFYPLNYRGWFQFAMVVAYKRQSCKFNKNL